MALKGNSIVVVPARGGSKRIPKKNIHPICGAPMIYWPLRELCKIFPKEKILISTDDPEIKQIVQKKGFKTPFSRPASLSDDFTGTMPVVQHALEWYETSHGQVDYVLVIYPTAVGLLSTWIHAAGDLIEKDSECAQVFSSCTYAFPIQRSIFLNKGGYAEMQYPQNYHRRSQDFDVALHDAGQFYIYRAAAVREGLDLTNSNAKPYIVPRHAVVDIDTFEDFEFAERILRLSHSQTNAENWDF